MPASRAGSGSKLRATPNRRAARKRAPKQTSTAAKQTVDGLIFDIAVGLGNLEGVRGEACRKFSKPCGKTIDQLAATAPNDTDLQRSRMAMLLRFSDIYTRTGDSKRALEIIAGML